MAHRSFKDDLLAGNGMTGLHATPSVEASRTVEANAQDRGIADDLLRGAAAIAEFLFGDSSHRRKVFHLAAKSRLPVFKLGSMWCARKSVLLKWIEDQEERNAGDRRKEGAPLTRRQLPELHPDQENQ